MFRITAIAALAASCGIAAAAPDVICGTLDDVNHYGIINGISAYAVGTTACNNGDVNLDWIDNSPNHPVIQVSIYRLADGRMEQLGVSFVKHSFASLQGNACGFGCGPGGTFSALGPGCSDPYGAGLNGSQTDLGPRSEINAWDGQFVYPYTSINQSGNAIYKRIQVQRTDMQTAGALYFAEGQYVIKDEFGHFQADGVTPTSYNNVSYKRMNIQASGSASTTGGTRREKSAMIAWQEHGNGVNTPDPDVFVEMIAVPNEGKLEVAGKVTDLGDGTYRYDYAVHNQNSHMSVGSFSVPNASGTSGYYFNDVDYHDSVDALIDGTDWAPVEDASGISWATDTFASNVNANAIRWGTTYNFSFVSDQAPEEGEVTVGMWRDASVSLTATLPVPSGSCAADLDGDGALTFFDISAFLNAFNTQDPIADFDGDGNYTFFDVSGFLNAYNAGCP